MLSLAQVFYHFKYNDLFLLTARLYLINSNQKIDALSSYVQQGAAHKNRAVIANHNYPLDPKPVSI